MIQEELNGLASSAASSVEALFERNEMELTGGVAARRRRVDSPLPFLVASRKSTSAMKREERISIRGCVEASCLELIRPLKCNYVRSSYYTDSIKCVLFHLGFVRICERMFAKTPDRPTDRPTGLTRIATMLPVTQI